MTSTQHQQPQVDLKLPDTVDTAGSKLLYLYLSIENEATIDELQAALGMKKITLYSLLQTLRNADLVERVGANYVCDDQPTDRGNQ